MKFQRNLEKAIIALIAKHGERYAIKCGKKAMIAFIKKSDYLQQEIYDDALSFVLENQL